MSAKLTIDTRQFQQALKEYAKVSKADFATILNRFGAEVAGICTRTTPIAKNNASGTGKYNPAKKSYEGRLYYAKAAMAGVKKGKGPPVIETLTPTGRTKKKPKLIEGPMTKAANSRYGKARKSVGYMRAGWLNPLADLSGKPLRRKPIKGLSADKGYGLKATTRNLVAWLYNKARGTDPVAFAALQGAINEVARRRLEYARDPLRKTAKRFSGKK